MVTTNDILGILVNHLSIFSEHSWISFTLAMCAICVQYYTMHSRCIQKDIVYLCFILLSLSLLSKKVSPKFTESLQTAPCGLNELWIWTALNWLYWYTSVKSISKKSGLLKSAIIAGGSHCCWFFFFLCSLKKPKLISIHLHYIGGRNVREGCLETWTNKTETTWMTRYHYVSVVPNKQPFLWQNILNLS